MQQSPDFPLTIYLLSCNILHMESQPAIVNTAEARKMLGDIDRSTLKRWVDSGRVTPFRKLPGETGGYLFYRAEIERLAAELLTELEAKAAALRAPAEQAEAAAS